ncbi:uncharacterized protein LOC123546768 [Mercenaria mercenaria]|uniref:uncharacterized protein LOC123546768 n=1 Tax=Mercenaria mercenaria TaxID=6596 RepID=UPI00234E837E|nr:uncharacterized protein LOC123546768 [Mercenaria mercenaria]
MRLTFWLLALCHVLYSTNGANTTPSTVSFSAQVRHFQQELQQFQASIKTSISRLARQMMLQQTFVEERVRSDGSSGVKQIRNNGGGSRPYHFNTFSSGAFLSVHEHSNYDRTVGLGEFIAVLNGVEFRTRHNDYKLKMPSKTSKKYHAVENIPFPEIPPSVLSKKTVHEQVLEMQQYFKAFKEQNTKLRNYEPYFKSVLCYLEGAWTTDTQNLDEPFESDRHFIDASSWFDLQQKIQYMSSTGGKNNVENLSFLPTTVINVTEDGSPVYAQWNYRILCHPIKKSLKLQDFKPIDDLSSHMIGNYRRSFSDFSKYSKSIRFNLAPKHGTNYSADAGFGTFEDGHFHYNTLDQLMNEVPGVDNYPGHLTDDSFGELKYRVDTKTPTVLNTAHYHRHYRVLPKGNTGLSMENRGYSDTTLWVAQTTNPKIAEMEAKDCHLDLHTQKPVCRTYKSRSTYAIPLEIVWMTPLSSWNPYNLTLHTNRKDYQYVNADGRNGGLDKAHAFNGSSLPNYYLTPAEFFHGGEANRDPADTAKDVVGVLDQHGQVQRVSASGIRIFTPDINGVGKIRIRYPVAPAHQEGSALWKNIVALQDVLMDTMKFSQIFEQRPSTRDPNAHEPDTIYEMSITHTNPPGMHYHEVYITREEMIALERIGTRVRVYTSESNGHHHELTLTMDPQHSDLSTLLIVDCDGKETCWDGHNKEIRRKL